MNGMDSSGEAQLGRVWEDTYVQVSSPCSQSNCMYRSVVLALSSPCSQSNCMYMSVVLALIRIVCTCQ